MAGVHAIRVHRFAVDVLAASQAAMAAGRAVVHDPHYVTVRSAGWCDDPIVLDEIGYGHWRGDSEPEGGWPSGQDGSARRLRRSLRRKAPGERERVWTGDGTDDWVSARTLSRQVRCRRCDGCRREKRCMWAQRAVSEWRRAALKGGRTWFVTLTFHPTQHYLLQAKTRKRFADAGGNIDAQDWNTRYSEFLVEYHKEIDAFLARLRMGLASRSWKPACFRYLVVPEPHKGTDIRVHYHLLVHEVPTKGGEVVPLVRRRIEQAWRGDVLGGTAQTRGRAPRPDLGFVKVNLVKSPQQALYVTKYLGKNHYEGRLRVSMGYGAEGDDDQPSEARRRAFELSTVEREEVPQPPSHADTAALRVAMIESQEDDDDTECVRIGDHLGACPSGLHVGISCDCQPEAFEAESVPVEFDELRGTPRRKWPLRGWHETRPRSGSSIKSAATDDEAVH